MNIKSVVCMRFFLGIQKYAKEFEVEIVNQRGLTENDIEVELEGTMENLKKLNDKANGYRPNINKSNI